MKKIAPKPPAHKTTPADLRKAVAASAGAKATWKLVTPLARSEWICWVTSGAKAETRTKRIRVAIDKLEKGERRPCCWMGCTHRPDKPMSRSQKFVLGKKAKKSR